MTKSARETAAYAALFAAISLFLFQEAVLDGKAFCGGGDKTSVEAPALYLAAESLSRGELPFWNPYNFSGSRGLGDAYLRILYPLNFVIAKFFPNHIPLAMTVRVIVECALMIFLAWFFFAKVWQDKLLAAFSAIAYSLSSWCMVMVNLGPTFSSFVFPPLILYFLWDWRQRPLGRNIAFLSLSMALALSAGFHQYTAYFLAFSFLWALARLAAQGADRKAFARLFLIFTASSALAISLNSLEIFPFLEAQRLSNRLVQNYADFLKATSPSWYAVLRTALPFCFGNYTNFLLLGIQGSVNYAEGYPVYAGMPTLLFGLCAALFAAAGERKRVLPWALAIVLVTLMSLKSPLARIPYEIFLRSPLWHGRISCLIPLMMAFLAPIGIRMFLEKDASFQKKCALFSAAAAGVLYAAASGFTEPLFSFLYLLPMKGYEQNVPAIKTLFREAGLMALLTASAAAAAMELARRKAVGAAAFKIILTGLLVLELSYFARAHSLQLFYLKEPQWYPKNPVTEFLKSLPDQDRHRWYLDPVALGGAPPFDTFFYNYNIPYRLRDINGYANFIKAHYAALLTPMAPPGQEAVRHLPWRLIRTPQMADLFAVKYFVVPKTKGAMDAFGPFTQAIGSSENVIILAKPRALARWRLACKTMPAKNAEEVLDLAHKPGMNLADTVFVDPPDSWQYDWSQCPARHSREDGNPDPSHLEILQERGGYLKAKITTPQPALFVFTETWDPGWKAWIHAKDPLPKGEGRHVLSGVEGVRVHRVNHAFQAVEISPGEHILEMKFRSPSYPASVALTLLALAALGTLGFWGWLKRP